MSGRLLLNVAPKDIDSRDICRELEELQGVEGIHKLRVWSLDDHTQVASLQVSIKREDLMKWDKLSWRIKNVLHISNIHIATLELRPSDSQDEGGNVSPRYRD